MIRCAELGGAHAHPASFRGSRGRSRQELAKVAVLEISWQSRESPESLQNFFQLKVVSI